MYSRLIFIVSALLLGANVALAQEEEETFVPTTVEELLDAIGETMAEHEMGTEAPVPEGFERGTPTTVRRPWKWR